jgi:hypothetical protein
MALQIQGNGGTVQEVEAAHAPARVVIYPQDPFTLGYYSMCINNGTTIMAAGLAANSPIWSFRWGNSNLALIRSVTMSMSEGTVAFATGRCNFDLFFARSFTASDTGGTAATLTGNNGKKRTSFGTTLLTDLRYSTTATLSAGTRTLDTMAIGNVQVSNKVIESNSGTNLVLWQRDSSDEYPLVLAQNEGLVIQATVPATGTWFFSVKVEWMEIASY